MNDLGTSALLYTYPRTSNLYGSEESALVQEAATAAWWWMKCRPQRPLMFMICFVLNLIAWHETKAIIEEGNPFHNVRSNSYQDITSPMRETYFTYCAFFVTLAFLLVGCAIWDIIFSTLWDVPALLSLTEGVQGGMLIHWWCISSLLCLFTLAVFDHSGDNQIISRVLYAAILIVPHNYGLLDKHWRVYTSLCFLCWAITWPVIIVNTDFSSRSELGNSMMVMMTRSLEFVAMSMLVVLNIVSEMELRVLNDMRKHFSRAAPSDAHVRDIGASALSCIDQHFCSIQQEMEFLTIEPKRSMDQVDEVKREFTQQQFIFRAIFATTLPAEELHKMPLIDGHMPHYGFHMNVYTVYQQVLSRCSKTNAVVVSHPNTRQAVFTNNMAGFFLVMLCLHHHIMWEMNGNGDGAIISLSLDNPHGKMGVSTTLVITATAVVGEEKKHRDRGLLGIAMRTCKNFMRSEIMVSKIVTENQVKRQQYAIVVDRTLTGVVSSREILLRRLTASTSNTHSWLFVTSSTGNSLTNAMANLTRSFGIFTTFCDVHAVETSGPNVSEKKFLVLVIDESALQFHISQLVDVLHNVTHVVAVLTHSVKSTAATLSTKHGIDIAAVMHDKAAVKDTYVSVLSLTKMARLREYKAKESRHLQDNEINKERQMNIFASQERVDMTKQAGPDSVLEYVECIKSDSICELDNGEIENRQDTGEYEQEGGEEDE
jgi:hypothetical protein